MDLYIIKYEEDSGEVTEVSVLAETMLEALRKLFGNDIEYYPEIREIERKEVKS